MQWDVTQFQVDYSPSLGNLWTWPGQISMLKLPMVIYFSDRIVKHPTKMDWNQDQKENKFRNLPFWKSKLLIRQSNLPEKRWRSGNMRYLPGNKATIAFKCFFAFVLQGAWKTLKAVQRLSHRVK